MRLLYWALAALGALPLVLFAVSNRGAVALGLWPLPFIAEVPLYLVVLLSLVLGFAAGRLAGWFAGRGRRRELRRRGRQIDSLRRELAATQALLRQEPPAGPGLRASQTASAAARLPASG